MVSMLIIGAGFAGAASAYFLSQIPDLRIRLVEKEKDFGVHASGRNAAMIRQGVSELQVARWIQETLAFLKNPPANWEDPHLYQATGSLLLGEKSKLQILFDVLNQVGGVSRWIDSNHLPASLPDWLGKMLRSQQTLEGLYCPEDGVVRLRPFLGQLLAEAGKNGVEIFYENEVTEIKKIQGLWEVRHGKETFRGEAVLNGAGAWANALASLAGIPELPLVPHRRHIFKSKGWTHSNAGLPLVWDVAREVYFRPLDHELMLSPGDEDPHPVQDPAVAPEAPQWLKRKMAAAFPGMAPPMGGEVWACLRTKSPDKKMYIEQATENTGFFWVAGLGGHGVGASIGVGRQIQLQVRQWLKNINT